MTESRSRPPRVGLAGSVNLAANSGGDVPTTSSVGASTGKINSDSAMGGDSSWEAMEQEDCR